MNQTLKTGKLPHVTDGRDLDVANLGLTLGDVDVPAGDFGNYPLLGAGDDAFYDFSFPLGMYGNDEAGDCVPCWFAHGETLDSLEGGREEIAFTAEAVLSDYSAVTGYVRGDASTDRGTDMRNYLIYHRKTGILDAGGKRRKIGAFGGFNAKDVDQVLAVTAALGKAGIGFEVPNYAMAQFNAKEPFDIKKNASSQEAEIDGGHCIGIVGRYQEYLVVWTWGTLALMTPAFYEKLNDESWGYFSSEFLRDGRSISGLDKEKALQLVSSLS